MKRLLMFVTVLMYAALLSSQSPKRISYQALVRDKEDRIVSDAKIGLKISILKDTIKNFLLYSEVHQAQTNKNGLVTLAIGNGKATFGVFDSIDWSGGTPFIQIETDLKGGTNYSIVGISEIMSVPFALFTKTAQSVLEEHQGLSDVLQKSPLANGQIKNVFEPKDGMDAVNKDYVSLRSSLIGDTLYLGKNQHLILPGLSNANSPDVKIVTIGATDIGSTAVTLVGSLQHPGGSRVKEFGFLYSNFRNTTYNTGTKWIHADSTLGKYQFRLSSLLGGQTYYFKAFVVRLSGEVLYGEEMSFKTPGVSTINISAEQKEIMERVVGRGYDISGRYAYPADIKGAVLDLDLLLNSGMVQKDIYGSTNSTTISGNNSTDYQNNLTSSLTIKGGYRGFSGEVGVRFSKETTGSSDYAFVSRTICHQSHGYHLNYSSVPSKLKPFLSQAFIEDLKTLTPDEIISNYGTDVMMGGIWGARMDYNMSAFKKTNTVNTSLTRYAEASYNYLVSSAQIDGSITSNFEASYEKTKKEVRTNAYGGSSQYSQYIQDSGDYTAWLNSFTDDKMVFIDYYMSNGLMPIYELAPDSATRGSLQDARNLYLSSKRLIMVDNDSTVIIKKNLSLISLDKIAGDGQMNTQPGKKTKYEIEISVYTDSNPTKVIVKTKLTLTEDGGQGDSKFSKTFLSTIDINNIVKSINISPASFSASGNIVGQHNDWFSSTSIAEFPALKSWIKSIELCIDGPGDKDYEVAGIKLDLAIPITYTVGY